MNPLQVSSFVLNSTACAFTACEHVFVIDPGRVSSHAAATFIQLSGNMQASVIVAERARLCERVPRGSELADCSTPGAVRAA